MNQTETKTGIKYPHLRCHNDECDGEIVEVLIRREVKGMPGFMTETRVGKCEKCDSTWTFVRE